METAASTTTVVCRIGFHVKVSGGKKVVFVSEDKSRLPLKRCAKSWSAMVGSIRNLLFLCKAKECFRWHISLIFRMMSVIFSRNEIV